MSNVSKRFRRTWRKFCRKVKPAFAKGARAAARGVYMGAKEAGNGLRSLSNRTVLAASGALGFLLVAIVSLSLTVPKADEALSTAAMGAFAADDAVLSPTPTLPPLEEFPDELTGADGESPDAAEPTPDPAAAAEPFAEVRSGDDGAIIETLQRRLMELGYMDSDEPTQHFGPLTKHALVTFQRHNGLTDDGVCGEETYTLLMSESAKQYVMQLGDEGDDVEGVQQRLYELGYISEKKNIIGSFGEVTEAAVKEFQKKNKETSDGKVGSKTLEALYSEDPVSKAFSYGDEDPIIEDCQKALKKLGYITFKPDGRMGHVTVSAIKDFQEDNGLIRDGSLGPATRDLLLSGKAEPNVMQLGDSGAEVLSVQKRLVKLKYLSSGNATGYYGERTEEAVCAFQKRNSLGVDGKIGTVTLSTLNSSSARKASTSSTSTGSKGSSGSSGSTGSTGSSGSSTGTSTSVSGSGVTKLINLADSKIGCTYVRGAKGPNTFDCSGFVYWCLKNAGFSASYMTSIQWRNTSKYQRTTSMNDLQRGDILVFSGETSSSGHVGIYLGSGKMIDASSSAGCVRQSSTVLSSGGYWKKHFICAYHVS